MRPERRACGSVLQADRALARRCERAVRSFSTTRTNSPASGTPSKPSTSTGSPGLRLRDALAAVVVHRADAAPVGAGDERVADAQRAALDEHRDDRAAARVELGLDDDAGRLGVGVGLELLEVGDDLDRLEQVVEALLGLRRDVDELRVAAPLRRAAGRAAASSVRDAVGSAPSLSILLTATTIGTSAALAWSIASSVCGFTPSSAATTITAMSVDLGAAGAHGGERLVARGVEERDRAARRGATW